MRELRLRFFYLVFSLVTICSCLLHSQTVSIYDQEDAPLIGVEVFNKTMKYFAVSDDLGQVSLGNIEDSDTLVFRFLGFEEVRMSLTDLRVERFQIKLSPATHLLDELIILGRNQIKSSEIPYQVMTLDQKSIASTHSQSTADALGEHAGVFIQKSQMGGGSPVIRGFEANRVLLVVDGVRLNNAIYRNGHLQNAITVDASILNRMDVIFGPNSLMYGSDALGGVVHFRTKDPRLANGEEVRKKGHAFSRWSSANNEKTIHLDYEVGLKKIGLLTSISMSDFSDLKMGSSGRDDLGTFGLRLKYQTRDQENRDVETNNPDPFVQIGTKYRQLDLLQKFYFKPNLHSNFKANFQYSTTSDIPRYDNLSEERNGNLRWAEWYYGPQRRFLSSLTYNNYSPTRFFDNVIVIAGFQKIDEDRNTRLFNNEFLESQNEDVDVLSLTVDFTKSVNRRHSVSYGIDLQNNWVTSNAIGNSVLIPRAQNNVLSRYASDSNFLRSSGVYVSYKGQSKNEIFNLLGGLRYSKTETAIKYSREDPILWPTSFYEGIETDNDAFTWSVGATMNSPSGLQIRGMISTAFRSPNIDDLSKIRINSDEITFPNPTLKPEKSINAELTIGQALNQEFNLSLTGFYTDLENAIMRSPFNAPNGSTHYEINGENLRVEANQNLQEAYIAGISGNLLWKPNAHIIVKSSINYIQGREIINGQPNAPLSHIPPLYGSASIEYETDKFNLVLDLNYNGFKPIDEFGGTVDNPDLALPEGALAWRTLNIYAKRQFYNNMTIAAGIQNVFDSFYRPFSSGVSAAGRNFVLELRTDF